MSEDYHHTRDYYAAIVACLLAMDIAARTVSNQITFCIEVRLIDGTQVLWSNCLDSYVWAWSMVDLNGSVSYATTTHPEDLPVIEAVQMIARFDYPSPAEFPRVDPDELTRPV